MRIFGIVIIYGKAHVIRATGISAKLEEKELYKLLLGALVIVGALAIACSNEVETVDTAADAEPVQAAEAAAPREITLMVGAGEDTASVNAFLPSQVTVRVGDTVTWKLGHPDEVHTTTFLSGGMDFVGVLKLPVGSP